MLVPPLGGPQRKVAEFPLAPASFRMRTIDWCADGHFILAPVRPAGGGPAALNVIPVEGGEFRQLTSPPAWATVGDLQPALSPRGNELAFTRRSETITEIHI